jgi:hypothetical protein
MPPIRDVLVCHCRQCAQWTGYAVAATAVSAANFKLVSGADELKWYISSEHAERGFCGVCGSSLLWKPKDGSRMSVLAGALEAPTGLKVLAHIHVGSKSDYYDIPGDAAQYESGAGEHAMVDRPAPGFSDR